MNNEREEYTFFWFIENYSYCWHNYGMTLQGDPPLRSPEFITDELDSTSWVLRLHPRVNRLGNGKIALFLSRSDQDAGPEILPLDYELSVIAKDRPPLISYKGTFPFTKGLSSFPILIDAVLLQLKADYLPQDTLSVCCKIWKGKGTTINVGEYSARTRIGITKISFIHKVKNFSDLKPNEKKTIQTRDLGKTGHISSIIHFTNDGQMSVEIVPPSSNYILSIHKLYLLDGLGNVIECGEDDNRFDATRRDIQKMPLSLTRQEILKSKSEYLPNDELSLLFDCTFSTGVERESIEEIQLKLPRAAILVTQNCNNRCNNNAHYAAQNLSACPSVMYDLKTANSNQRLTEVVLKTKTKEFPAHKLVLCARSSVFKAMLMKEENTQYINMDDMEDDIVQQFLLFLYSDNLENLQWESAMKLYYAGDKYAIEELKMLCSSFFIQNICTSNAIDLLQLADTHNDSILKKFVEDFIFEYDVEVFGSDEFDKLIKTNLRLATKTLHLRFMRQKVGK